MRKRSLPRNIRAIVERIRKNNFPFEKIQEKRKYYGHEIDIRELKASYGFIGWSITYDNEYSIDVDFELQEITITNNNIKYIIHDYKNNNKK